MIIDTEKPVVLFSGQGSQKVGMAPDMDSNHRACETITCASDTFGFDIAKLMAEGPQELLDETQYAQAAIVSASLALYRACADQGFEASACLGFSLGQVSALYASGMLSLEDTFAFAKFRAEVMAEAAQVQKGSMCALLGADETSVQQLCDENAQGEVLVIANYNCPGQIVISGNTSAVKRALEAWTAQKKRAMMLATSGAFHSPLMEKAAEKLDSYLATIQFSTPHVPLISNVDAHPISVDVARKHLSEHLTQPVRFSQSVEMLVETGAHDFVEIGVGGVLIGLVKRIDKGSKRTLIDSVEKATEYRV